MSKLVLQSKAVEFTDVHFGGEYTQQRSYTGTSTWKKESNSKLEAGKQKA